MKKKEVTKLFNNYFKENLKELGFKSKGWELFKVDNNKTYRFSYVTYDYGDVYMPEFSMGVKMQSLNNIYREVFQKESNAFAFFTSQGVLHEQGKFHIDTMHHIKTEDDIINFGSEVVTYLKEKGLPYLETISNFKTLDKIHNENPTRPELGMKGLIFAKMAQNPNYEQLKKLYRQLFVDKNWAVQEDIDNLEKTIQFLDKHSFKELEKIAT